MTEFGAAGREAWFVDEGTYWTQLWASGGHPNSPVTCCGRTPVEHWAVRRWTSDVAGIAKVSGHLAKAIGQVGGDGVIGVIFVDGTEVYRQSIAGNDTTGIDHSLNVRLEIGSVVDLAIAPGASDGADSTTFTATIQLTALVLADSERDHSDVQGRNGWQYGFLPGSISPSGFQPLVQWVPGAFGDGRDVWFLDRASFRTALWQDGGHPNRDGGIHWATRRWVSSIAGQVTIAGRLAKGDTGGGDGITGRVIVDGTVGFQQVIAATDGVGVNYSISASVAPGSTVDLAIEAGGTENFDSTVFTAVISAAVDAGAASAFANGDCTKCAYSPDPVNLATGSFTTHAADLELPGRVLPFAFVRWYNSADAASGPFGPGWTHSFHWRLRQAGASVHLRRGDGRQEIYLRRSDGSYAGPPDAFDVLVKNADGTFTLTLPTQVAYAFAATGELLRIHEPAGNEIVLSYTGSDLTQITDSVGRAATLSHDGQGRLTALQDVLGRRTTYAYDAQGRLATVTDRLGSALGADPLAHQWRYAYEGTGHHLATITDPDGRSRVTNTYDAQGRVIEQRDGEGRLTTISYGTLTTTLVDPRGHKSTYTFDDRTRVLSQTDVVGGTTYTIAYTYDAAGNRTTVTDREGHTTDLTYDARGNVLTKTDPSPDGAAPRPVTAFAYDARNNLTEITDALGSLTTLTYDPATDVLLSVARQVDATTTATTSYEYGDPANHGLPTRIYSPRGNASGTPDPTFSTALQYDAQGDLVRRADADGAVTTFEYDAAGRLLALVDPDGNAPSGVPSQHRWAIEYDALDRETRRTDPLGNVLRYAYDGAGNRTNLTDRNGNVTAYAYDGDARLVSVTQKPDPAGPTTYVTSVTRDGNGNATRITQANGVLTDYAFDALDRLTSVTTYPTPTTPLTTTYVLDGNGRPTSRTTGDGVTVTYAYDALARLTSVSGPSLSIAYSYDALGRRTSMSDATGSTTYQYDRLGRVTQVAAPVGTLGYAYDLDGNRTQLIYPGGDPVAYTYSPGGRLVTVTDWAGRASSYSHLASGLVSALALPNGLTTTYGYDRAQRLTSVSTRNATTALFSQAYTLDAEGNRTRRDDAVVGLPTITTELDHDGLSRLLSAERRVTLDGTSLPSETFTLDAATNLASRTGPDATYSYDGANRLLSDGTRVFVWDGADRLVQRGADLFGYDPLARLTSATVAGATTTYAYDGDGLLRSRTQGSAQAAYLWDTSLPPAPLMAAGSERVVQGLGPLYRVLPDGSYRVFIRDALGSVRAEVDGAGSVTGIFDYLSYGEPRGFPYQTPPLLGFTGELRDPATGLIYLRSRWYHPDTGRFMSSDPYLGTAERPSSLNAFGYVAGRPTVFTDPLGLDPADETRDPGLGCQKFVLCHVLPVLSPEADTAMSGSAMLLIPIRGRSGPR